MRTTRARLTAAGPGAAVAAGLVVAGPVLTASAADRPNSLGAARGAAPTKVNAWIDNEALTSRGRQFERVTVKVKAGSYYVRVFTPQSSSRTPYRLRLRVLPAGVFILDQATYTKTWNGGRFARVNATFVNNATTWQSLRSWTLRYYDAAGSELQPPGTSVAGGEMNQNKIRIAPGGTASVTTTWNSVPAATARIVATPEVIEVAALPASGLSIALDSKRANAITRGGGETSYWVKITNTGSTSASYAAQAKHFSTIGNLTEAGESYGDIKAGQTISRRIVITTTDTVPNLLRFAVWRSL